LLLLIQLYVKTEKNATKPKQCPVIKYKVTGGKSETPSSKRLFKTCILTKFFLCVPRGILFHHTLISVISFFLSSNIWNSSKFSFLMQFLLTNGLQITPLKAKHVLLNGLLALVMCLLDFLFLSHLSNYPMLCPYYIYTRCESLEHGTVLIP